MSVLAAIRPDDWNFPVLLHVFGAMVLVGGLVVALSAQLYGLRRRSADALAYARMGFFAVLFVAFPAWWLMRIGGQWIYSREGFSGDGDPAWVEVGYVVGDLGGLLLLVTILVAGFGVRRLRRPDAVSSVLVRLAAVVTTLLLVANLIAVWAMSAKPA